ncbi:nose resistant to fluoxetine protein 6-like [Anthonomus grandis grandis]|uniref:nose resistant to fluoxetine protein 6-like n=1 Tax=Anthonomus grandis grandis TaxID=2921223 RepID=UPI002165B114|nr:nose resistant to fluoxetine protein 6-like [Anthonomus grandis grandis]
MDLFSPLFLGIFAFFFESSRGEKIDLFPDLPLGVIGGENVLCREQSRIYMEALGNLSLWAYEMRDGTSKSVQGILRGSIAQFGHFEECLSAQAPFPTQYCVTNLVADVPTPSNPRDPKLLSYFTNESVISKIYDKNDPSQQPENVVQLGWCVPASCKPTDLENHLNQYLATAESALRSKNINYTAYVPADQCQVSMNDRRWDHLDISFLLVSGIIVMLVIASTICDSTWTNEEKLFGGSPLRNLLISFSIKKNYPKLARTEDSNPALRVLYGMRVFCICMIITDHRFGTFLSNAILNFNTVEEQYRSFFGTLFFHGDLFVDSFFILSGLLVTYCLLVQFEKKFLNPAFIILMRYIRITPLYAFVIFFCSTMFEYIGHGPMWKKIISPEVRDCRRNWWTNLLYVSNYVNPEHMCMVHSWYLSCDFHYFVTALFLSILLQRMKKTGLVVLGIVFVVSILVPFVIVFINQRPAVLFFYLDFIRSPKSHPDFLLTYIKSHARSTPYIVGMFAGYMFFRLRQQKANVSWFLSYLIFTVSITLMVVSIVSGAIFYDPYYEYNTLDAAAYSSLHRTVWSIGSIGVLYVASYGKIGWVYAFLSWRPWIPLSKLVYGAYLVHFQIQLRGAAKKASADVTSYFDIICYAISDIVLSFGLALVLYLAVEAPIRNVFSLLFFPPKGDKKKEAIANNNNNNNEGETVSETTCDSHL